MVRIRIRLTEEQARALTELAAQRGVSMAELIRQSVERTLAERDEDEKWRRALNLSGRFRSGLTDVSKRHDKYLEEGILT